MPSERIASWALLAALGGCDGAGSVDAPAPAAASASAPSVAIGTRVVAAWGGARYREGKVVEVQGNDVTFEHGVPDAKLGRRPRSTVTAEQAWPVGAASPAPAPGDALVCRTGDTLWVPCRVRAVTGDAVTVEDHRGQPHELASAATDLVRPSEQVRADIDAYLVTEARHRAFDAAFRDAGAPRRPADYRPQVGDRVVAHWVGTSYYGATVRAVRDETTRQRQAQPARVRLRWDGSTFDDQDKPIDEVAPLPGPGSAPSAGGFVLVRPAAEGGRWEHQRVVVVDGDTLTLVDRDDTEHTAKLGDVLVIEPRPTAAERGEEE